MTPAPEATSENIEGKKEACKTYVDQTKLLVTLASAFLIAPAVVVVKSSNGRPVVEQGAFWWFIATEASFVVSVLLGYGVLASVAGSQDDGSYDVYRLATRGLSLLQLILYVTGLVLFVVLITKNTGT